jgi:hypothetical protein
MQQLVRKLHLELLQGQAAILDLEQQLRRQRIAKLPQRVLVLPQPPLQRLWESEICPSGLQCLGSERTASR